MRLKQTSYHLVHEQHPLHVQPLVADALARTEFAAHGLLDPECLPPSAMIRNGNNQISQKLARNLC